VTIRREVTNEEREFGGLPTVLGCITGRLS
jgi:hypothetical protein